MNEEYRVGKCDVSFTIDFNQKVDPSDSQSSKSTTLNTGYLYLKYIYEQLDLKTFFKKKCTGRKLKFNPDEINSFLTYARILDPDSKLGTFDRLDSYYGASWILWFLFTMTTLHGFTIIQTGLSAEILLSSTMTAPISILRLNGVMMITWILLPVRYSVV